MALNTNRSSNIFTPRFAELDAQLWEQVTGKKRTVHAVSLPPLPPVKAKSKDPIAEYKLLRAKNELKVVRENLHEAIQKADSIELKLAELKKRGIARFGSSFTFGK